MKGSYLEIRELLPKPTRTIKILLLGSYDKSTTHTMRDLIDKLNDIYDSKSRGRLITLLAEDVTVFENRSQSDSYMLITERRRSHCTVRLFRDDKTIDTSDREESELPNIIRQVNEIVNRSGEYKEITATLKVRTLCKWADLVGIIRQEALTRGGELIELTMITCLAVFNIEDFTRKTLVFHKKEIQLSWMMEEMMALGKLNCKSFSNFDELLYKFKEEIDALIDREALRAQAH